MRRGRPERNRDERGDRHERQDGNRSLGSTRRENPLEHRHRIAESGLQRSERAVAPADYQGHALADEQDEAGLHGRATAPNQRRVPQPAERSEIECSPGSVGDAE